MPIRCNQTLYSIGYPQYKYKINVHNNKIYTVLRIIYDSIQGKPVYLIGKTFIQINIPYK